MTIDYNGKIAKPDSRTSKPIKYYPVGFHKSIHYQNQDSAEKGWVDTPSKYQFAADVYRLGNMLRMHYLDVRTLFFLQNFWAEPVNIGMAEYGDRSLQSKALNSWEC